MKRFVALVLVLVMAAALSVTAFAAGSQVGPGPGNQGENTTTIGIYNSEDKRIAKAPVTTATPSRAKKLADADREAFLKAYEDAKNIKDRVVRSFFWLDIPEKYKTMDGFAYAKYNFTAKGENVKLTVNGKEMEVVSEGGTKYYAKLTEFGSICVTSD